MSSVLGLVIAGHGFLGAIDSKLRVKTEKMQGRRRTKVASSTEVQKAQGCKDGLKA